MTNFASEFRDVFSLYVKLGNEFSRLLNISDADDSGTAVHAILQNKDSLTRISQMNSRISSLSDDWNQFRLHLDAADREEADTMAAAAQTQALRLQQLCRIHAQKIQSIHDKLRNNLAEIHKGARYAKGLKPHSHNYPKFIDSSC